MYVIETLELEYQLGEQPAAQVCPTLHERKGVTDSPPCVKLQLGTTLVPLVISPMGLHIAQDTVLGPSMKC